MVSNFSRQDDQIRMDVLWIRRDDTQAANVMTTPDTRVIGICAGDCSASRAVACSTHDDDSDSVPTLDIGNNDTGVRSETRVGII